MHVYAGLEESLADLRKRVRTPEGERQHASHEAGTQTQTSDEHEEMLADMHAAKERANELKRCVCVCV